MMPSSSILGRTLTNECGDQGEQSVLHPLCFPEREAAQPPRLDKDSNKNETPHAAFPSLLVTPFAVAYDNILYGTGKEGQYRHKSQDNHHHHHSAPFSSSVARNDSFVDQHLDCDSSRLLEDDTSDKENHKQQLFHIPEEGHGEDDKNDCEESDALFNSSASRKSNHGTTNDSEVAPHVWWTWRNQDFEQNGRQISQLISNSSGTILVVASEQAGTVSILRGRDGRVLATRQVVPAPSTTSQVEEADGSSFPKVTIRLSFVASSLPSSESSDKDDSGGVDDLLVETIPSTEWALSSAPSWILVSNIHGMDLNAVDESVMAQAASKLKIQRIPTDSLASCGIVRQTIPFVVNDQTNNENGERRIRFLVVVEEMNNDLEPADKEKENNEEELHLLFYDYSAESNSIVRLESLVSKASSFFPDKTKFSSGLHLTTGGRSLTHDPLIVFSAAGIQDSPAVVWVDPVQCKPINVYHFAASKKSDDATAQLHQTKHVSGKSQTRVVALTSIHDSSSTNDASCVACAVESFKNTPSRSTPTCKIVVLQALLSPEINTSPRVLFEIPMTEAPSRLGSVVLTSVAHHSFAVRAGWTFAPKTKGLVESDVKLWDFVPNPEAACTIAQVRHLLAQQSYDKAQETIVSASAPSCTSLEIPYSGFHALEIPSFRFESLINSIPLMKDGSSSNYSSASIILPEIKDCIDALSRDSKRFLQACEFLWKSSAFSTIKDLRRLWSYIDFHLKKISTPSDKALEQVLSPMQQKVQDRLMALQLVEEFCKRHQSLRLDQVTSVDALVSLLVQEEYYDTVVNMWMTLGAATSLKGQEVSSKPILNVDALLLAFCEHCGPSSSGDGQLYEGLRDPSTYTQLLLRIILPALAINHPLLGLLRAWCCNTANGLDDIGKLDAAIDLLRVSEQVALNSW